MSYYKIINSNGKYIIRKIKFTYKYPFYKYEYNFQIGMIFHLFNTTFNTLHEFDLYLDTYEFGNASLFSIKKRKKMFFRVLTQSKINKNVDIEYKKNFLWFIPYWSKFDDIAITPSIYYGSKVLQLTRWTYENGLYLTDIKHTNKYLYYTAIDKMNRLKYTINDIESIFDCYLIGNPID